jgi:hypothetical protein
MADKKEDLILPDDGESPQEPDKLEGAPENKPAADEQSPEFTGLESISEGEDSLTAISEPSPEADLAEKNEAEEAAEPGDAEPSFLDDEQSPELAASEEAAEPGDAVPSSLDDEQPPELAVAEEAEEEASEPGDAVPSFLDDEQPPELAAAEEAEEEAEQPEESEEIVFTNDIADELEDWGEEESAASGEEDLEGFGDDGLSLPDLEEQAAMESAESYTAPEKEPVFEATVEPRVLFKGILPQKGLLDSRKKYFWAIDIGSHTIKVIGLKQKRKGVELAFLSLVFSGGSSSRLSSS